jgi:CRP-like cAMP-binding protein
MSRGAPVRATPAEVAEPRPGDDLVAPADVVMDRGFTLDAPPQDTQQELASTLGISNASVARALRDLRATGAVTIRQNEISIHPQ